MGDRILNTSSPLSGVTHLTNLGNLFDYLYDNISLVPTSIVNSGSAYTITIDPVLDVGTDVVQGMSFYIQPNATNPSAGVTLRIGTNPYYDVLKANGDPIDAGQFSSDTLYKLVFYSGAYRIVSVSSSNAGVGLYRTTFTSSGTWNKPSGLDPNAIAIIEVWGGGGGGGTGNYKQGGGGGGGYNCGTILVSDLGSSETVTIGAGGTAASPGNVGGTSSFGAHVQATGGGGGATNNQTTGSGGGGGGGGGGQITAGTSATNTTSTTAAINGLGGRLGGGDGNTDANNIWGGGGGKAASGSGEGTGSGFYAVFGGGGGAGYNTNNSSAGTGGTSLYGGDGGNGNAAGNVPGGGGGGGAAGAAGQVIVTIIG